MHELLVDLEGYVEWWPQVRAVAKIDEDRAFVVCRSALPYDLDLVLDARDRSVERLLVTIEGPFTGWACWRLSRSGTGTALLFEQEVTVVSRPMRLASYVARPVLTWNHHRMMLGAAKGLAARFHS